MNHTITTEQLDTVIQHLKSGVTCSEDDRDDWWDAEARHLVYRLLKIKDSGAADPVGLPAGEHTGPASTAPTWSDFP